LIYGKRCASLEKNKQVGRLALKESTAKNALKGVKKTFNKAAKWTATTAIAATAVLGLATASVYGLGQDLATDSYQDYANANGIPQAIVDHSPVKDKIRVYKNDISTYFYKVGQMTAYETSYQLAVDESKEEIEEGASFGRAWRTAYYGITNWADNMASITVKNQHPLGAYSLTLPGSDTCYLNPPDDMTLPEFVSQFTSIHPDNLLDLESLKEINPKIPVMIHEASHCSSNPPISFMDSFMASYTLQGEARADSDAAEMINKHFKDSIMPEIFYNIRAVAPLRSPYSVGASHATAPLIDSPLNDGEKFSREDVYAAYIHLNELVKARTLNYKPLADDEIPYWLATYIVIKFDILNDKNLDVTRATHRAAELYVEGVEYLVPDLAPQVKPAQPKQPSFLEDPFKYVFG
tara:strand:+ start:364 stop:1587 length:1224 start_codon:yes stop_codon:yes gene_type:complete